MGQGLESKPTQSSTATDLRKMKKGLRVMTILGTRPEIIRLARILPKLDGYLDHKIVYTNQSFSPELSTVFFKDFKLREPDYVLDVKSKTLGGQIANIIQQTEEVMVKEKPDAILILGDTNSALSAIMAKRMKIPIFHMEAGNRAFDDNVPEEVNRRIVDHISDYNLSYTEHGRRYLIEEGIHPGTIYVTGSPLGEVLDHYKNDIEKSDILDRLGLEKRKYFVASTHREENVDNTKHLRELFGALNYIAQSYKLPVIVSLHPRTKDRLSKIAIKLSKLIRLEIPFGFLDYNKLQKHALCVLSDSGTIQEESAILGFSAIQIRVSSERPEAFDAGTIILTGHNRETIQKAIEIVVSLEKKGEKPDIPEAYKVTNVSTKVLKLILGLVSIRKYTAER